MIAYVFDVARFLASSPGFQELLDLAEVPHDRRCGIDDWDRDECSGAVNVAYLGRDVEVSLCIMGQQVNVSASHMWDPSVVSTDVDLEWEDLEWRSTGFLSRLVTDLVMPTAMIECDRADGYDRDMHAVTRESSSTCRKRGGCPTESVCKYRRRCDVM